MKKKISICMEENTIKELENKLIKDNRIFRSRSHIIEFAINEFIKNQTKEEKKWQ